MFKGLGCFSRGLEFSFQNSLWRLSTTYVSSSRASEPSGLCSHLHSHVCSQIHFIKNKSLKKNHFLQFPHTSGPNPVKPTYHRHSYIRTISALPPLHGTDLPAQSKPMWVSIFMSRICLHRSLCCLFIFLLSLFLAPLFLFLNYYLFM